MGILDYVKIGVALTLMAIGGYLFYEYNDMKSNLATEKGKVATQQATINEMGVVDKANQQAIKDLKDGKANAEAALAKANRNAQGTTTVVEKWRTKYVQVGAEKCDGVVTGRDLSTLDGVRAAAYAATPADPNAGGKGIPSGRPAGGPTTSANP